MVITADAIDPVACYAQLQDHSCGACVTFEGWVRNHQDGREVRSLEYEVYHPLAVSEGERVIAEARARHPVTHALCVHREGHLELGDLAVWVGVSSPHRDESFLAARMVIDQIKVRLPIWKKEHYLDGDSGWVNCERCANHGHAHS
ncbi:MAG: molybdenum cofactor biosynthesis protein MoaE [Pseudomonadota bacterium]